MLTLNGSKSFHTFETQRSDVSIRVKSPDLRSIYCEFAPVGVSIDAKARRLASASREGEKA